MNAPNREAAGRAARALGLALEDDLDAYHAQLATEGRAFIRRVGTPHTVKSGRVKGLFTVAYTGRQGCDFSGYVRPLGGGAVPIVIEAKTHQGADAWSMQAIDEAQRMELARYATDGCCAMVVLRAWGRHFVFRWHSLTLHRATSSRWTVRPDEAATVGTELTWVRWFAEVVL